MENVNVNVKLKSIYFDWAINYDGPPPRSLSATFEDYLELERYTFLGDELWLEKILSECNLYDKSEFDMQIILIKDQFSMYSDQQKKKREKRINKQLNIHYNDCKIRGVLPF